MLALAARGFDEQPSAVEPQPQPVPASTGSGQLPLPASPGVAVGPALFLRSADVEIPAEDTADPTTEWRRVREALAVVRREIQRVRATAAREVGESEARIFDAHLMFIDDAHLLDDVHARVETGRVRAACVGRCRRPGRGRVRRRRRPLPAGPRRGRARGRATGGPRAGGRRGVPHRRRGGARRRRPDPGPGRRSRPRSGAGHRARLGQPDRAQRDPGPVARHPRGGRGRCRCARPSRPGRPSPSTARRARCSSIRRTRTCADLHERHRRARAKAETALAAADQPAATLDGIDVQVGCQPRLRRRRARRSQGRRGRRGLVRTEFLFLGRDDGAGRRGAGGGLPRTRRGPRRPPDHPAHARRRWRQAPVLRAAADRGEPLPRRPRHPASRSPSPTCCATSSTAIVRTAARDTGERDVPDGEHGGGARRGAAQAGRGDRPRRPRPTGRAPGRDHGRGAGDRA